MVFYQYTYIHRNGKICNWGCYHPKGFYVHRNSPPQVFCKEYGKLSYSGYEYCDEHARKYRKREQYHRKMMVDLISTQIVAGNLKVNENNTVCH
jgi:hypothetical protein